MAGTAQVGRIGLAGALLSAAVLAGGAAAAADLGGNCCADLEERIAELEATVARKGNRKVSLKVSGQVNHALMLWDDGGERNAYIVGNKNDQSNFSFSGEAAISPELTAGYTLTVRLRDGLADEVHQGSDDPGFGFQVWESFWFLESKRLGKLSLGQAARVTNTVPESDLSQTAVAGYAGVQDLSGAFALRLATGALTGVVWGDLYAHFNGDTANIVRYDTPVMKGFVLSASWGEDDMWDVGARYEGEVGGFKLLGAAAYSRMTDDNGLDGSGGRSGSAIVGSLAVLHEATGLNALIAGARRTFDDPLLDGDGVLRTPADRHFIYAKLGWIAKLNGLGPTAFYGEYGRFTNFLTASATLTPADIGSAAVRFTGNSAQVWGLGVVQHIEAAEMQLYLGYRRHRADFDLVDGGGAAVAAPSLESFQTLVMGSKIAF